ncbi:MAG: hypothetical protein FJ276_01905 [Planctomycetes bacterium]|nr:hypothetical protein [Planctomycetota bacterium]
MFVLAVNCMYYHHDEQGFWEHFCPLIGISDQAWLGDVIESKLLEFHFLEQPRHGPYKNVTPLRDQCGITRSEIPRFADLLRWMSEQYGWDGIRVLDQGRLSSIVSARSPSGHLSGFLKAAQGHAFVRDVARNVSQFQRRILSMEELTTLTGYRSGFFAELFEAIGRTPSPPEANLTRPPPPRLLFLPEFRQVGLCFDPRAVMRGDFRLEGEVVRQTPYLWQSPDDYGTSVAGLRRDSDGEWSNWSVLGWDPTRSPVALFHVARGFIDHRASPPPPGEYFMLGPYAAPPPHEICAGDYGMVDLPFPDIELDAWRIVLTDSTDLAFLGLERPAELESIAWSNTNSRLAGTLESAMAFTGSLPALTIRRTELFTSNAVALFIDDGVESRRIHIEPGATNVLLDVAAPSQGRVWVEPISRLREFAGRDTLCELHYCLLPECDIQWPSSLYSFDEQPEITLSARATNLSLGLDNATPIDSDKRQWRAAAGTTVLQGSLRTTRFAVPIAQRIRRATLREQHKQIATYMLPEQTQKSDAWILDGMPRESADLAITDGITDLPLGTLGDFNAAGECRFPGTAIRDALAHWGSPVGMLAVCRAGQAVPTGTRYVDSAALIEWISTACTDESPAWLNVLDTPLRNFVETVLLVRNAPQRVVGFPEDLTMIPEELQTFFTTVRACSVIFDDALLPESPDMPTERVAESVATASVMASKMLSWYLKANAFVQAPPRAGNPTAEALCEEYTKMSWRPPFPRWRKAIDGILGHIKPDDELIKEWKQDVEGGFRSCYPSRIANQNGGRKLTEAWIQYYKHAQYQNPINELYYLIPKAGSPVAETAATLLVICYMRKGVFSFSPPQLRTSQECTLNDVYEEIKQLAMMGAKSGIAARPDLTALAKFLSALPLRAEDVALIKILGSETGYKSHDSDWLTCYYLCLLYESGLEMEEPMATREMLNVVPASSPVKQRIIDTLERHLHD